MPTLTSGASFKLLTLRITEFYSSFPPTFLPQLSFLLQVHNVYKFGRNVSSEFFAVSNY
jgi:hypothetical protein